MSRSRLVIVSFVFSLASWIVKRWYWTVENTFEFEGKLQKEPPTTASTD